MLTIFRRHQRRCPHRVKGRAFRHCQCPLWVDGFMPGNPNRVRKSLDTRDWLNAQAAVRTMEARASRHGWNCIMAKVAEETPEGPLYQSRAPEPITLAQTWDKFLADIRRRELDESTIKKYERLRQQMQDFAARYNLSFLNQFDLDALTTFRVEWREGPRTSLKKLERLRCYFRFCERRKWIAENPASELKPPKVTLKPTMPFSREEMMRILAAIDLYAKRAGSANAQRLRAFVLLLRYSGLRIGDAVKLSVENVVENKVMLYMEKTGEPVRVPLPPVAVQALDAAPRTSPQHFFWTGKSKLHNAIGVWQRRLRVLFRLAEISEGHAHRFRDTFSVELLLAGVPIDRVSKFLGHSSMRVTEKHYAPWSRARQEQAEADVEKAWVLDPVAGQYGTRVAHENEHRVN